MQKTLIAVLALALAFTAVNAKFQTHNFSRQTGEPASPAPATPAPPAEPTEVGPPKKICISKEIFRNDCGFESNSVHPYLFKGIKKLHQQEKDAIEYYQLASCFIKSNPSLKYFECYKNSLVKCHPTLSQVTPKSPAAIITEPLYKFLEEKLVEEGCNCISDESHKEQLAEINKKLTADKPNLIQIESTFSTLHINDKKAPEFWQCAQHASRKLNKAYSMFQEIQMSNKAFEEVLVQYRLNKCTAEFNAEVEGSVYAQVNMDNDIKLTNQINNTATTKETLGQFAFTLKEGWTSKFAQCYFKSIEAAGIQIAPPAPPAPAPGPAPAPAPAAGASPSI